MACASRCGPGANPSNWDNWIICSESFPQPLVPDSELVSVAAANGGKSSDWTLCFAVAALKVRRLIYYKSVPGDCGSNSTNLSGSTLATLKVASGLGVAARTDPEPISSAILSGIASITGIFGAHHAQAVQTEQTTNCQVVAAFNAILVQLEQAVKGGQLSPDQAGQILSQAAGQLDPQLAQISKPVNLSYGMRVAMRALVDFETNTAFPLLAPQNNIPVITPVVSGLFSPPQESPGAPGSSGYVGASGYIPTPLNANNAGMGATAPIVLQPGQAIPENIPVGTLLLIGGVAFVASKL